MATVLVTGAGFTKAFYPAAPLIEDDYGIASLADDLRSLSYAHKILEAELTHYARCKVNIERLLTRLDSGMPYDLDHSATREVGVALQKVMLAFTRKIEAVKQGQPIPDLIKKLARICLIRGVSVVTFNYDDILDEAFFRATDLIDSNNMTYTGWLPEMGYGFPCKSVIGSDHYPTDLRNWRSVFILKLHGSLNWRITKGARKPYEIGSVRHLESWRDIRAFPKGRPEVLLEPEPLIVPPVMAKEAVQREPILRVVWGESFKCLSEASEVIFVGYSFPPTDLASRYLCSEALNRTGVTVRVINYVAPTAPNPDEIKANIRRSYREVLRDIPDSAFSFDGAAPWAEAFTARDHL